MPVILRRGALKFLFYSNEGSPREPPHVHVREGAKEAKIWLAPLVSVSKSTDFSAKELRAIIKLVQEYRQEIEEAWHEHFGD